MNPAKLIVKLIRLISPEMRVDLSAWLLIVSFVAWIVTSRTIWKTEQQGILFLSYFAIWLTCINTILTADVRAEQENGD